MRVLQYGADDLEPVINRLGLDYSQIMSQVKEIVDSVEKEGDGALINYTRKFDQVKLQSIRVPHAVINKAYERLEINVVKAIDGAHKNIRSLHLAQFDSLRREWMYEVDDGVFVGERMTPIERVGCYIPGGRASYPSSVLMTVVPAKIAGVQRIVVVSPPPISDAVLAACKIAGVDEVYQVGGAQAVAALAYGTDSIKPVSKIVGPGNKYVTAAKMQVYGLVDIDMPAGPSEILVIADESANPSFIAADILAQAEHDPNAQCVLVTTSSKVADDVKELVEAKSTNSPKAKILKDSLKNFTIIKTNSIAEAIDFANQYAPEHLEIHTKNPDDNARKIINAGAIFIGSYCPVAVGDHASGGNHVLPTGGAAKYSSPLTVRDYLKSTSIQKTTKKGLQKLAQIITTIAQEEGLTEHKKSVEVRIKD